MLADSIFEQEFTYSKPKKCPFAISNSIHSYTSILILDSAMRQKHFIDLHKGVTPLFVLILIAVYDQWQNPTAWVYLGLHGTYGLLWVLKSRFFPDRSWEQNTSLAYGLVIWVGLSLYWLAPWLLTSRGVHAPAWLLGLCVALTTSGVFFHFSSDMQKYTILSRQPGRLITEGLFSLSRNINYFGEFLIYLGFALLAVHWLPVVILMAWVSFVWLPNMRRKDRSLARYPGFEAYKQRTRLFIPYIF
jgi:protein-S-isoprenylcysteine O-methyltransferase Ste14